MTLEYLNQHLELRRRLAKAENLLAALRTAAEPSAQVITGMPHAPGYRNKLGDLAAEIADVSAEIEHTREIIRKQEPEIMSFISAIPDGYTRTVFRLRFLYGMGWRRTAATVDGGNTAMSIRQSVYRYLKSCNTM